MYQVTLRSLKKDEVSEDKVLWEWGMLGEVNLTN